MRRIDDGAVTFDGDKMQSASRIIQWEFDADAQLFVHFDQFVGFGRRENHQLTRTIVRIDAVGCLQVIFRVIAQASAVCVRMDQKS